MICSKHGFLKFSFPAYACCSFGNAAISASKSFAKLGEELKLEETEAFADNLAHAKREILAQMALGEAMKDILFLKKKQKNIIKRMKISLWLEKQFMRSIFL